MGFRKKKKLIPAKTPGELDAMEAAGRIVGLALVAVKEQAQAGMTTAQLDAIAEEVIRSNGAIPTFKGYQGFPASICCSINDEIVHGIPGSRVLQPGDLVSVDCGATLDGWVGDSAWTFGIGELAQEADALNKATEWVLAEGLKAMVPGAHLTDVSAALERATLRAEEKFGVELGIVDGYGGHGIGREMHEDPYLANWGKPGRGPIIQAGSVLAIEPMLTLGEADNYVAADDWTVLSDTGAVASHWEHTVAATEAGPRILTPRPV